MQCAATTKNNYSSLLRLSLLSVLLIVTILLVGTGKAEIQHQENRDSNSIDSVLSSDEEIIDSMFGASSMSTTADNSSDIYVPPDINQLTPDARSWYLRGVSNANERLADFASISTNITQSKEINADLKTALGSLLTQVSDANGNTKDLVPKLKYLIESLSDWSKSPISLWAKIKLKTTIAYVNGKRDNKSYFLLNGGALWCKLRVEKYLDPISSQYKVAQELAQDLNTFKTEILGARDSLDNAAQEYVQGLTKLVDLVGDLGKNGKEFHSIAAGMKEGMNAKSANILKTSQDSVDHIQAKINSL